MSKQEESAEEKMEKAIKEVFSQYLSEQRSVAVKRGILHRVKNGYAVSRPPLGYSITETPGLFKINLPGTVLREELKDLASGYTTIESVAAKLGSAFDPFDSNPELWSVTKVKRLLSNPYYAGWISYKGQLYPGLHEPMITNEQHEQLLDLLHDMKVANSLKPVDKSL